LGAGPRLGGVVLNSLIRGEPDRSGSGHCEHLSILTRPAALDVTWTHARRMLESSPPSRAMLRSMRRRSRPEPLKPRREATWLVVRDRLSQVVESTPLEPLVDLRAVLTAAREARIAEGWECEEIGSCVAFFFCTRGGVREMVIIERCPPPAVGERR